MADGCNKEALPFYDTSHLFSTISRQLPRQRSMPHLYSKIYHFWKYYHSVLGAFFPKSINKGESFDVIVVIKTWLSLDFWTLKLAFWDIAWKDRNCHGGRVAIYINTSIPYSPLHLQHPDLELIIAECYFGAHLLTIAGFYHPPSSSTDVMFKLHNIILLLRPQNFSNVVISSDLLIPLDNTIGTFLT